MAITIKKLRDSSGNIIIAAGKTVPPAGSPGYALGCIFIQTDATTAATARYTNLGTALSALFVQDQGLTAPAGQIQIPFTFYSLEANINRFTFINATTYELTVIGVSLIYPIAEATLVSSTLDIRNIPAAVTAPSGGVSIISTPISLKATANTTVTPTLAAAANLIIPVNGKISLVSANTAGAAFNEFRNATGVIRANVI